MAPSILLVFEKPAANDPRAQQQWLGLASNLKTLANSNKDIQILGENCLLLPTDKGLDIFYQVLEPHLSLGVSYKYLILPEEIEWYVVKK